MPEYEYLEHTADLKFRSYGKDFPQALANSARALVNAIYGKTDGRPDDSRKFRFECGDDKKRIVHDFLSEIMYVSQYEGFIPLEYRMDYDGIDLEVAVSGRKYREDADQILQEIKAITFHDMKVDVTEGECVIEVLVDT